MASVNTSKIIINARALSAPHAGMGHYIKEMLRHWPDQPHTIRPRWMSSGMSGHAWEQFCLPMHCRGSLLWNPANTGPLTIANQVVTIHDMAPLDHPEWSTKQFARWYRYLLPALARRSQAVITVSQYSKQRILHWSGVDASKVHVIPLGVDGRFHPLAAQNSESIHARYGIKTRHYFLTVSSIEPRKNLDGLVTAWQLARPRLSPEWSLVVAGARGVSRVFREVQFGKIDSSICLPGFIAAEDLPALYANAAGFIFVPHYEGFGNPILEAMASGVPTICSNCTSMPEVAGDAAVLVDPRDSANIADKIIELAHGDSVRQSLRVRGVERARGFNWQMTAQRTIEILARHGNG